MSIYTVAGIGNESGIITLPGVLAEIGFKTGYPSDIQEPKAFYVINPGVDGNAFSYPDEKITFVLDGATMQIDTPEGAVLPLTWESSNPYKAEIAEGGVITWHNTGSVTFTATDAMQVQFYFNFSPNKFIVLKDVLDTPEQVAEFCELLGGRSPTHTEMTNDPGANSSIERASRVIGTFCGEWGRLSYGGIDYYTHPILLEEVDPVTEPPTYYNVTSSADGGELNTSTVTGGKMVGACILPYAPASYIINPESHAYLFYYPSDKITTVFEGAVMQLNPPGNLSQPVTWVSSDPGVAGISETGFVSWHDSGSVTFTATDTTGLIYEFDFSPSRFFAFKDSQNHHSYAVDYCASLGGRMPTWAGDLLSKDTHTSGGGASGKRAIGTLCGEWGLLAYIATINSSHRIWAEEVDPVTQPPTYYNVQSGTSGGVLYESGDGSTPMIAACVLSKAPK